MWVCIDDGWNEGRRAERHADSLAGGQEGKWEGLQGPDRTKDEYTDIN